MAGTFCFEVVFFWILAGKDGLTFFGVMKMERARIKKRLFGIAVPLVVVRARTEVRELGAVCARALVAVVEPAFWTGELIDCLGC